MKKYFFTFLQYAIPLLLAVLLMRFLLAQVSMEQLVSTFREANYGWVVLSWGLAVVAHLSRAYRWKLLLEPLGYHPKLQNTFVAVMVGYFANFALPRIGEVARCSVLKSTDNIPFNSSFGTVVAERVFDLVMLLLFIGITVLLEFNKLNIFFTDFLATRMTGYQQLLDKTWLVLVILSGFFVILAVTCWIFSEKILQLTLVKKGLLFVSGIWKGVISVKDLEKKWEFVFHTFFIWMLYYFMIYVLFFALPQTSALTWRAGFVIFVVGSFGMAAPVQGGIGTFHLLVSQALIFYGLTQQDGISLANFMHLTQLILLFGVGAVCSFVYWFFLRKKTANPPAVPQL